MSTAASLPPADRWASAGVVIRARATDHPDGVALLRSFYREQVSRYGFAESAILDPAEFSPPNGLFVVVYDRDEAVGCGAVHWHDRRTATAEIKKTYLLPSVRRRGLGGFVLDALESEAAGIGAERIVLESGVRNTAALALFVAHGYQLTGGYVPGRDPAVNRAFSKALTSK